MSDWPIPSPAYFAYTPASRAFAYTARMAAARALTMERWSREASSGALLSLAGLCVRVEARLGYERLEQFNRVARRVFEDRLFATHASDDVAAEARSSVA